MPSEPTLITQLARDFPERLHPVSRIFLDAYLDQRMSAEAFQRFFSLPNSDYIQLAECLVRLVSG